MAFEVSIWLAVTATTPTQSEAQAFWNSKENHLLDEVTDVDRLWLGHSRAVTPEEPQSPGAAGKVFDLLFLLGTIPTYQLPVITDDLIKQLVEAFDSGATDNLPAAPRPALTTFLRQRRGKHIAPDSQLITS